METKTSTPSQKYRLLTGIEIECFNLELKLYTSRLELHERFLASRVISGWAEQMVGLMPMVKRKTYLLLGVVSSRELGLEGACFSYQTLDQKFTNAGVLHCPAQVGPDFWQAERIQLQPEEHFQIHMTPITTDEELGVSGIFEVVQKYGVSGRLGAHSASGECGFKDTDRFVVQLPPV